MINRAKKKTNKSSLTPTMVLKSVAALSLGFLVLHGVMVGPYRFPLHARKRNPSPHQTLHPGETYAPLSGMNVQEGHWSAILSISPDDQAALPSGMRRRAIFELTDPVSMKALQARLALKVSGGDLATATSSLAICKDGQIVWEESIVLEESTLGFQSPQFGWAVPPDPDALRAVLQGFHPVYWPVIFR